MNRMLTAAVATALLATTAAPVTAAPVAQTQEQGRTELDRVERKVDALLTGEGLARRQLPPCRDARRGAGTPTGEDLAALEWMAGDWKGTGWTMTEQGTMTYIQTEHIRAVEGGDVLDVTGTAYDPVRGKDIVFTAHATATYDKSSGAYLWRAASGGFTTEVEMAVGEGTWAWEVDYGPGIVMRFETTTSHNGRAWYETGALSTDGGQTWTQTLEMTLVKTCDA